MRAQACLRQPLMQFDNVSNSQCKCHELSKNRIGVRKFLEFLTLRLHDGCQFLEDAFPGHVKAVHISSCGVWVHETMHHFVEQMSTVCFDIITNHGGEDGTCGSCLDPTYSVFVNQLCDKPIKIVVAKSFWDACFLRLFL